MKTNNTIKLKIENGHEYPVAIYKKEINDDVNIAIRNPMFRILKND